MRLIEADAKHLLAQRGLKVPSGAQLVENEQAVKGKNTAVAVKAQVLQGNRAAAGLIELVQPEDAVAATQRVAAAMRDMGVPPLVLLEDQVEFQAEYYAAWRIDVISGKAMLLFSLSGGSGIESRAGDVAQYLHSWLQPMLPYHLVPFLKDLGLPSEHLASVARYCADLYEVFCKEEATLLEINPLVVLEKNRVMALDAKMVLDSAADARQRQRASYVSAGLQASADTGLETAAAKAGFTFVELEGPVAVFSAGAGLGMCLTDILADAGIPAANFCDATGGAGPEKWASMARVVFQRAQSDDVKAILVFFTLTATSIKSVVEGLFMAMEQVSVPKPMVVGLVCAAAAEQEMTFEAAAKAVNARGYTCVASLPAAVEATKRLVSEQ